MAKEDAKLTTRGINRPFLDGAEQLRKNGWIAQFGKQLACEFRLRFTERTAAIEQRVELDQDG